MPRRVAYQGIFPLIIILAVLVSACDTRPMPAVFDETTTTTLPIGGPVITTPPTLPPPDERVVGSVVSVTDGDTVQLRIAGIEHNVRLLGINAPEISECWGEEAAAQLSATLLGKEVLVVSGTEDVDSEGRLLRYLYLDVPGGPVFINAEMVRAGSALGLQNGHEFEREFKLFEARAFQSGRGMWGTLVCGDQEAISADRPVLRISEIEYDPAGPDNDNLNEEWVTITNQGYGRVSIAGWVLRDESSLHRWTFPSGTVLAPGDEITVVTGCNGGPENAFHWCSDSAVWSNQGDTAIVSDTLGNAVIWHTYTGEAP